jgi:hypothetical protein
VSGSLSVLVVAMAALGLPFLLATCLLARGVRVVAGLLLLGTVLAFCLRSGAQWGWPATALRVPGAEAVIAAGLVAMTAMVLASRAAD